MSGPYLHDVVSQSIRPNVLKTEALHIPHLMSVYNLLVTLAFAYAQNAKFIGSKMISHVGPIILYYVCKMQIPAAGCKLFVSSKCTGQQEAWPTYVPEIGPTFEAGTPTSSLVALLRLQGNLRNLFLPEKHLL